MRSSDSTDSGAASGQQDEIDFGGHRFLLRKGLVQDVIQDLAVPPPFVIQGRVETTECRCGTVGFKSHPSRQFGQLPFVRRKGVGLLIEHDLQEMLDMPQKDVPVFEDVAFQACQATGCFELGDAVERIAGPNGRELATVQQLQELDDKLDIANTAPANFHILGHGAGTNRFLFHLPLEQLDVDNVTMAEERPIDPRIHPLTNASSQIQTARHRASLDPRLAFPIATFGLVILPAPPTR